MVRGSGARAYANEAVHGRGEVQVVNVKEAKNLGLRQQD